MSRNCGQVSTCVKNWSLTRSILILTDGDNSFYTNRKKKTSDRKLARWKDRSNDRETMIAPRKNKIRRWTWLNEMWENIRQRYKKQEVNIRKFVRDFFFIVLSFMSCFKFSTIIYRTSFASQILLLYLIVSQCRPQKKRMMVPHETSYGTVSVKIGST